VTGDGGEPDNATLARRLIRACDRAALGTVGTGGGPYTSLVLTACNAAGAPLLLMSDLAEHSKNIAADARVSLLFEQSAGADAPLETARLSVIGRAAPTDAPAARERYLRRHPDAVQYADFGDFRFYQVTVARAHLVAGFGLISWIEADALLPDQAATELAAAETDIIEHMNGDHRDALDLYATRLLGHGGDGWTMTGIDPDGLDLRRGGGTARLDFDAPVTTPADARTMLAKLAETARAAAGA
jgi:putative heme iron utilization protein